jgi:hypothetical protein
MFLMKSVECTGMAMLALTAEGRALQQVLVKIHRMLKCDLRNFVLALQRLPGRARRKENAMEIIIRSSRVRKR